MISQILFDLHKTWNTVFWEVVWMLSLSSCDFRKKFFPGFQVSVRKEGFLGMVFWELWEHAVLQVLQILPVHRADIIQSSLPSLCTNNQAQSYSLVTGHSMAKGGLGLSQVLELQPCSCRVLLMSVQGKDWRSNDHYHLPCLRNKMKGDSSQVTLTLLSA